VSQLAYIDEIQKSSNGKFELRCYDKNDQKIVLKDFDNVIANVGFHPDSSLYRELQVHQCYASEGPMKLAVSLITSGGADCLSQKSESSDVLMNPEPNFFILGGKSYGRNSKFLIKVGLEQIDQICSHLSKGRMISIQVKEFLVFSLSGRKHTQLPK